MAIDDRNRADEEAFYDKVALLVDSIDDINRLDKADFFKGSFDAAFKLIPEAQKGSLYELRDERYVPVYAKGYDMVVLSRLSFSKEEAFIDFECRNPVTIDACESWIRGRDEKAFPPETIAAFKELGTYSGFVSLHAPIQVEGRNIGIICLENFEGKGFSRTSKKILMFYARLISSYYSKWMENEEKNRLLAGKLDSLRQLAAGVAHELNTPLGAAQSAIANLRDGFGRSLPGLIGLARDTNIAEDALLARLLDRAPEMATGPVAPRATLRSLSQRLEGKGMRRPGEMAELLCHLGYEAGSEELEDFFGQAWNPEFLDLLLELHEIELMLGVAGTATHKMTKIIKLLQFYTRVERPKALEAVDVATCLDGVLKVMGGQIPGTITIERDYGPARAAAGEPDRLGQVWINLITNAIQAMEGKGRLGLLIAEEGEVIRVEVSDEGRGIDEALRRHIFDPFFTTKEPGEGTGLGLAIAKTIVESCLGTLAFRTSPAGTAFIVMLPVWREGLRGEVETPRSGA